MTTFEKNSNKHTYPPTTVHNHGQKNHFTFGFDGTYSHHELQYSYSINVLCFLPLSECEMLYLDLFHVLLSGMDCTYSALM